MKEFDFNELTEKQIVSKGMDRALIADDESSLKMRLTPLVSMKSMMAIMMSPAPRHRPSWKV